MSTITTPRGDIFIREALPADAIQFRELRLLALQESPTAFSADYETNASKPMSFWQNRIADTTGAAIFFAEINEQLIGMTGIRCGETPKTRHNGYILSVYVHPHWRGLRIAESLIGACAEWASRNQITILKLAVVATNTSAIRCYERCGFITYGTEPDTIIYDGQSYNEYLMYRQL